VSRVLPYVLLVLLAAGFGYSRVAPGGGGGDGADGSTGSSPAGAGQVVRVVRVVDGDTIRVAIGGRQERVRLIGVDTPETVKPDTPVQCFGKKASAFTHRLLDGRRVRLVQDVEPRDRYGRLLAYVYRAGDGLFVNAQLVRDGYARTMTIPPNVRFADRFRDLAAQARRAGRGLWSAC
jgi:micrococcal nuclease